MDFRWGFHRFQNFYIYILMDFMLFYFRFMALEHYQPWLKKNKSHLRSYEPYAQFSSWTVWNVSCAIFPISTVWKKWKSVEVQFDYTRWFLGPLDIPHWTFVTNFGLKTNLTLPWSRIRAQRNQGDPRSFFENKIVIIRKDACSIPLRYLGY